MLMLMILVCASKIISLKATKGEKKKAKRNQDIDLNSRRTEMEPLAKDEAWDSNLSDKESP